MKRLILTRTRTFKAAIATSAVIAILMVAQGLFAQGLLLTGYADFELTAKNFGSKDGTNFSFDNHHFNLIGIGQISGNMFAAAEVEYEHSGSEVALEYGYLAYTGLNNLNIIAGKFIMPFGRFNKDLHPTWINKMIDRPLGFKEILPQTYSDAGIWLSGAIPTGNGARITYDVYAVNGLMGSDSSGIRHMRGNIDDNGGVDGNKALGGRIGLELAPQGFDIGASIYSGNYSDDPNNDLTLTMYGVDAAFRKNGFELRAEMVSASQDVSDGSWTKTGGYAQASYLVGGKWEPVVRYSTRNMPGESKDNSRISFGVSYYISAAAAFRINYHINGEKSGSKDNDVFVMQFTTNL
ncbi:MAG: porin [Saprospiraceae bacterium]